MTVAQWLLLHGTPLHPDAWDDVRAELERHGRVLAPQLPAPEGPADAQGQVAERLLATLGPGAGPFHVVGHSFGGQVALEVALRRPDLVATLAIVCSRATPFPAFAAAAASLRAGGPIDVDGGLARWFTEAELATSHPIVGRVRRALEAADRTVWADELDAIATYDRIADLGSITAPTSVIAAALDRVGTVEDMSAMAEAIDGATFQVLDGASHCSPFCDPDALAGRLLGAAARGA